MSIKQFLGLSISGSFSVVFFLLLFAISGSCMAQLPKEVKVSKPSVVSKTVLKESELATLNSANNWGQDAKTNKYWVVYSDRANNTTYKSPGSSSVAGYLKFNEEVRIAEIQNGFAHVYTEGDPRTKYPKITNIAEDKGWIPMDNLLLWESCPVNEKGIYRKALIVVNLNETKKETAKNLFKVYLNPETRVDKGKATSSINFRFIMKEDKKSGLVLLANQHKVTGSNDEILYGWVDRQSYVLWSNRLCLEPNYDQSDIKYFKDKGEKLSIYVNGSLTGDKAAADFEYGSITNTDAKSNADRYRMPKGSLRYPILDKDDQAGDNVYKCNVFANPEGATLTGVAKHNEEVIKKAERVNLIVVIDGTRSMEPYFPAVKEAIKNSIGYFEGEHFDVRVGIVIYRDYADGDCVTECLSLREHTDPKIGKFLDDGGDKGYGIKSSPNDKTYEEALYAGLMVATDKQQMGFNDKESNLLLVVGDCGNDPKDTKYRQEDIIRRLVVNQFQVVSFQVRKQNMPAFNYFTDQMSDIIKGNIQQQIDAVNIKNEKSDPLQVRFKREANSYVLDAGLANKYYIGSLLQPQNGMDMQGKLLSEYISSSLENYSKAIACQREVYVDIMGNTTDETELSFNKEFLASRLGDDYVKALIQTNSILSYPCYTPKQDSMGHDYWKTVIYISSDELDDLLTRLRGVYQASKDRDFNNREPYIRAMKGVVKAMIGEIPDEELNKMQPTEVMQMIFGLNAEIGSTSSSNKRSIEDILNPKVVGDAEYETILNVFERKYENLQRVKTSGYDFCLEINGLTYYWLPTDILP